MEQVLKLDKDCEEAVNELYNCKVLQLMVDTYENYCFFFFFNDEIVGKHAT